jgi:hypothetical protein
LELYVFIEHIINSINIMNNTKKKCKTHVIDKYTHRKRLCRLPLKNNDMYCLVHTINPIITQTDKFNELNNNNSKVGVCCFCKNECNPQSQACGRCARLTSTLGTHLWPNNYNVNHFLSIFYQILDED